MFYLPFLVAVTDFAGRFNALLRLKLLVNHGPHIIVSQNPFQELCKLQEFPVVRVFEPRLDRHAVIQLVPKGMRRVVYENRLAQVAIKDVQVLQIISFHMKAGLPEETVLNVDIVCDTEKGVRLERIVEKMMDRITQEQTRKATYLDQYDQEVHWRKHAARQ